MINNLFILSHSYYEEYSPYYFIGPESVSQKEFKLLCDSFLEKAGYRAVENQIFQECPSWIGWREVVESMIPLLEKLGYHRFQPKIINYFGGSIIDKRKDAEGLGKATDIILNYNDKLHRKIK